MKKRTLFYLLSVTTMSLILVGCGPIYETKYTYIPPHSARVRVCIADNCKRDELLCQSNCIRRHNACEKRASEEAREAFHEYAIQQRKNHQPIEKTVDDFKTSWGCSSSCDCKHVYRECYTTCGGTVIADTVCKDFCKKGQ